MELHNEHPSGDTVLAITDGVQGTDLGHMHVGHSPETMMRVQDHHERKCS